MPLSLLTAVELFHGITGKDAERIDRLCAERRFPEGRTIFSRGDPGNALYIVKEGLVRIVAVSDKGTETILHLLKPGAIFGELLLSEEKRALTAVAGSDVLATVIPRNNLIEILTTIPAVSGNFIRLLSRRLMNVERHFVDFGHTWSYHRLAKVLLQLCDEHGRETPKGCVIPLRLTHEDLANLIGTTRETVTTQLNRFRRLGLVKRQDRKLVVNRPRLQEFIRGGQDAAG